MKKQEPSLFEERYYPKPCPFCGGRAIATLSPIYKTVWVRCERCGAGVSHGCNEDTVDDMLHTIDIAVLKWNTRRAQL